MTRFILLAMWIATLYAFAYAPVPTIVVMVVLLIFNNGRNKEH